ncbi:MAG: beta-galactosidase [Verrucomicrobiota bacterium JB024]|nr:beta-galactosidase [Verrucomicrobiota bacterium JB024]
MKNSFKMTLILCAFTLSVLQSVGAEESGGPYGGFGPISSRELSSVPWAHRYGEGILIELGDSGSITDPRHPDNQLSLLLTNRTSSSVTVYPSLKLIMPSQAGPNGKDEVWEVFDGQPLTLKAGTTVAQTIPVKLTRQGVLRALAARGDYTLAGMRIVIEVRDEQGAVLPAISDSGHFCVAPLGDAPALPQAAIVQHEGIPMLEINGVTYPGNFGYVGWSWHPSRQGVKDFAMTGRHIYEIVFQPWSIFKDGQLDPNLFEYKMNQMVASIVGRDPQALIMVRWWMYVPKDWQQFHPDEVVVYDDGSKNLRMPAGLDNQASYCSPLWRDQFTTIVREGVRRLIKSPYADRIFALRVGYGNCGEWNGFGYQGRKFGDFSIHGREAYVKWLQEKYTDIERLNAAWNSDLQDWSEVEVPGTAERMEVDFGVMRDPAVAGNYSDYYRFWSDYTVSLIEYFGRIVKEESSGKLLYSTFYGYFLHHLTASPYHSLDSGHYAMTRLLRSPVIDMIGSPHNYLDREKNISQGIALDSVKAHGKLFIVEDDMTTHESTDWPHRKDVFASTPEDSIAWHWRNYSRILTWGVAGYWYDFSRDWFTSPELIEMARRIQDVNDFARTVPNDSVAQVAVMLDEPSIFDLSLDSANYGKSLYKTVAYQLDQAGAPWDCFLTSDIDRVVAQDRYRVLIFMNQLRQSRQVQVALQNFKGAVVWVYGAGAISERGLSEVSEWIGMRIRYEPDSSAYHLMTDGTPIAEPEDTPVTPLAVIDDDQATILARHATGEPGFGYKPRIGGGDTYFTGIPWLNSWMLAPVYERAGVYHYIKSGRVNLYASKSFLGLWSHSLSGPVTISLPEVAEVVVDLWTGEVIGRNISEWTVDASVSSSSNSGQPLARLYYYGPVMDPMPPVQSTD